MWMVAAVLSVLAQDGGKLDWRGKNEAPRAAMADARQRGQPLLLFFTSFG